MWEHTCGVNVTYHENHLEESSSRSVVGGTPHPLDWNSNPASVTFYTRGIHEKTLIGKYYSSRFYKHFCANILQEEYTQEVS